MGFITAVPARIRACSGGDEQRDGVAMVEINFLCVHKKLRSKRLAPVLIKVRSCGCLAADARGCDMGATTSRELPASSLPQVSAAIIGAPIHVRLGHSACMSHCQDTRMCCILCCIGAIPTRAEHS